MNRFTWLLKTLSKATMKRLKFIMNGSSNLPTVINIRQTTTCWQHSSVGLVPYLQIAIATIKQNTLFKHKEFVITYEATMADAKEYQKLLEL